MKEFKIALRNVLRNKRRSFFTIFGIVSGALALLMARGFMEYSFMGLSQIFINTTGHLQIFNNTYFDDQVKTKSAKMINDAPQIIELVEAQAHVDFTMSRIDVTGIVGNEESSTYFIGSGIEPLKEQKAGLGGVFHTLKAGKILNSNDYSKINIGEQIAKNLGAKVGDQVVLMVTVEGAINVLDAQVCGILQGSEAPVIKMNKAFAQDLLVNDFVDKIVVRLDDNENLEKVKNNLENIFAEQKQNLVIKTWRDLNPYYGSVVSLYERIFGFMMLVVMVIMVLSIINTMMMAIYERTKEIGIIRAMGGTAGKIISLFLKESILLGGLGFVMTVAFGILFSQTINNLGLRMPPPPGFSSSYPLKIYLTGSAFLEVFLITLISTTMAGLYPALKATKIKIIDALRFI